MKDSTKDKLYEAWAYCDEEDKSTEFMFQYMADTANVSYDTAVDFVMKYGGKKREEYYKQKNSQN